MAVCAHKSVTRREGLVSCARLLQQGGKGTIDYYTALMAVCAHKSVTRREGLISCATLSTRGQRSTPTTVCAHKSVTRREGLTSCATLSTRGKRSTPTTALYILYTALMAVRVCSQECDSEGGPRVMCYTHNILNKGAKVNTYDRLLHGSDGGVCSQECDSEGGPRLLCHADSYTQQGGKDMIDYYTALCSQV
ncbi:uncharacterized protein LOC135345840 [Halichondria panicea]|uniref:uncharacterized protein LOC135345840 n=1 Tax=Halichondria panicea TaxID=6063 RepID=UPI00312B4B9F